MQPTTIRLEAKTLTRLSVFVLVVFCASPVACTKSKWEQGDIVRKADLSGIWTPSNLGTYFRDLASDEEIALEVRQDGSFEAEIFPLDDPSLGGTETHQVLLKGTWGIEQRVSTSGAVSWHLILRPIGSNPVTLEVLKFGNRLWLSHVIDPKYNPVAFWKSSSLPYP